MHRHPVAGLPSRHFRLRDLPVRKQYLKVDDIPRHGSEPKLRVLAHDYESPLEPMRTLQRSYSTASGEPTLKWVSASGAGGMHFPVVDDWDARQHDKLRVIQRQTMKKSRGGINQALQGYTDYNILEHIVPNKPVNSSDPRIRYLTNYEINSRFMTSALKAENLTPYGFDIISNQPKRC
ncbi:hypothetical protein FOL47_009169 [Perkinsus chesapeaki]|uniref:Uncharacterized protein n=1 Tax=Perkinsus chesapeaki TaxID=330153 RepID=A0A7J6MSC4_PERCH|nr:hypothetical protein FOL47_009169 [Perkinsus chesapeaki]